MTERTFNIIMACKKWNACDVIDNVKAYMANECEVKMSDYSQSHISSIMEDAMCDYLDTCDQPSVFVRELLNNISYYGSSISSGEAIAITLRNTRVMYDGKYINGFGEWMK